MNEYHSLFYLMVIYFRVILSCFDAKCDANTKSIHNYYHKRFFGVDSEDNTPCYVRNISSLKSNTLNIENFFNQIRSDAAKSNLKDFKLSDDLQKTSPSKMQKLVLWYLKNQNGSC